VAAPLDASNSRIPAVHPLGSPYVRDQLSMRTTPLNEERVRVDRGYVLYWMQSAQRFEDNWALRLATVEADRLNKPLLVWHDVDRGEAGVSPRFDAFLREGAAELSERAVRLGLAYRFAGDAPQGLTWAAAGAALIVTDQHAVTFTTTRAATLARGAGCRVLMVDSIGLVPVACFAKEEYSPRTLRPRYLRHFEHAMEPVEDRPPKRTIPASVLDALPPAAPLPATSAANTERDARVARGGLRCARQRLQAFVSDGLGSYRLRRANPSDEAGTSRLSAYVRHGMISPREIVARVREAAEPDECAAFVDEAVIWRELAVNFCRFNPSPGSISALPAWSQRTIADHADDVREVTYTLGQLESASTHDALWNATQRELLTTGAMHPVARMLWGKAIVSWAPSCADALSWMLTLNDRHALDGRDAAGFAGIQWCLGKFDRPFAERPVSGLIRSMSLERAHAKYDVAQYVARWSGSETTMA